MCANGNEDICCFTYFYIHDNWDSNFIKMKNTLELFYFIIFSGCKDKEPISTRIMMLTEKK